MTTILHETFDGPEMHPALRWTHPPVTRQVHNGYLLVEPGAKTDYWQRTHYGFSADNGPFLSMPVAGDVVISTYVRFHPRHQYDQAGLMVRVDSQHWIKTSVEYEPDEPDRLGAVVTNRGYSDWSTQAFPEGVRAVALRIRRTGDDYIVDCVLSDDEHPPAPTDDLHWTQIRMAHLLNPTSGPILCGLYACSPTGGGYRAEFAYLRIERLDDA
jgi:regulation of enolase protein 1 (concanavalin A-like superfamily)